MFRIVKKQIRPSTSIPFYFEINPTSADYKLYVKTNYIDTGKFLSSSQKFSDDKLEAILVSTWASHQDFLDYATDKFCYTTLTIPSQTYDIDNDILSEITVEEN